MTPAQPPGREWVALALAIGLATAVNLLTLAVLIDAAVSDQPGLSENATQILVSVFGGIVGVLGTYLGYQAGRRKGDEDLEQLEALGDALDEEQQQPSVEREEPAAPVTGSP